MNLNKINNFLLFLLAAYVPFVDTFHIFLFKILVFKYLYICLIVYYLIFIVLTRKKIVLNKVGNVSLFLILFFISQLISGLFANDTDLALQKVYAEFQFLVIFIIVNKMFIDNNSYEYVLKGFLVGFLVSFVIAMLQKNGVKGFYLFSEEELNQNTGLMGVMKGNKNAIIRIWGPFGNSLGFAEYLSTVGIILYSYYRMIKRSSIKSILILVITIYCIILTVSRTSLFALILSLLIIEIIYARLNNSNLPVYMISFFILISIAFLFLKPAADGIPLMKRFSNAGNDFKTARLNLWIKGYQAFSKNIFFGVGPGNLRGALSSEGFPMTSVLISQFEGQHVENYFLTVLYTYGIIGFYFCMMIYYYTISYSYLLFKFFRKQVKSFAYGGLFFGAIIVLMINNITIPIFEERIKLLVIIVFASINNSYLFFYKLGFFNINYFKKTIEKITE